MAHRTEGTVGGEGKLAFSRNSKPRIPFSLCYPATRGVVATAVMSCVVLCPIPSRLRAYWWMDGWTWSRRRRSEEAVFAVRKDRVHDWTGMGWNWTMIESRVIVLCRLQGRLVVGQVNVIDPFLQECNLIIWQILSLTTRQPSSWHGGGVGGEQANLKSFGPRSGKTTRIRLCLTSHPFEKSTHHSFSIQSTAPHPHPVPITCRNWKESFEENCGS